ncbi:hypothetical protein [Pseudoprimorskyibacter insulae]|nr:hypothetical protein [Pseudoprimorskyibacter insulae]
MSVWLEPVLVLLSCTFSVFAIWITTRELSSVALRQDGAFNLLRPDVQTSAQKDQPGPDERRAYIVRLMHGSTTRRDQDQDAPISFDDALRRAVRRIMSAWEHSSPETATDSDILELFLFCRVMTTDAPEAGRLMQLFLKPELVLDMREHLLKVRLTHEMFERQRTQYEAARAVWQMRSDRAYKLKDSLERLAVPDPDLWHHIVTTHEPRFKDQRDAAFWCLMQSSCDQATIAAFFMRVVEDQLLVRALRVGDTDCSDAIREIAQRWNGGYYTNSEFDLKMDNLAHVYQSGLADELSAAQRLFRQDPVDLPLRVFRDYMGRPPRDRSNWSLSRGTMMTPPREEDYVVMQSSAA